MKVPWSVGLAQKCTPAGALGSVGLKKESTPDGSKGTLLLLQKFICQYKQRIHPRGGA